MKYIIIALVLFFTQINTSCSKKSGFTCDSPLPASFHCLENSAGEKAVTSFKIPNLVDAGVWNSKDFGFCIKYNSDGTGIISFKPSFFTQGSSQRIKWGALVDSNGEFILSNFGGVYIIHENVDKSVNIDPQIALLNFNINKSEFFGFDLLPVKECPY